MEEIKDAITNQLYALELPDTQEELYVQPRTFTRSSLTGTCFSDLPTELRLQIYRETFPPPRHVRLFLQLEGEEKFDSLPLPVALQVTRESRHETLRHYRLFSQASIPGLEAPYEEEIWEAKISMHPHPLCVDPGRDSVMFSFHNVSYGADFYHLLWHMMKAEPEIFRKVKKVTALTWWWEPKETFEWKLNSRYSQGAMFGRNVLTWFTGLEELEVWFKDFSDLFEAEEDGYEKDVVGWFEEAKERGTELTIPRIYGSCSKHNRYI